MHIKWNMVCGMGVAIMTGCGEPVGPTGARVPLTIPPALQTIHINQGTWSETLTPVSSNADVGPINLGANFTYTTLVRVQVTGGPIRPVVNWGDPPPMVTSDNQLGDPLMPADSTMQDGTTRT